MTDALLVPQAVEGWKVARLAVVNGHLPGSWRPRFMPLTARTLVAPVDVARCLAGTTAGAIEHPEDQTPHADCRCGYYAKPDRIAPGRSAVALRVELDGRVVEHADPGIYGGSVYRAQRQRVVAIELPDECACGATAVALRADRNADPSTGARELYVLCALCDLDLPRRGDQWSRAELAALYGVDVSWTSDWRPAGAMPWAAAATLGVTMHAAANAMQAFGAALQHVTVTLSAAFTSSTLDDLERIARELGQVDSEHTRREGETALEWKARRDDEQARRLDRLYGPPRTPRHAQLGRRPPLRTRLHTRRR